MPLLISNLQSCRWSCYRYIDNLTVFPRKQFRCSFLLVSLNKLKEMEGSLRLPFSLIFKIRWRLSPSRRAHDVRIVRESIRATLKVLVIKITVIFIKLSYSIYVYHLKSRKLMFVLIHLFPNRKVNKLINKH